MDERTATLISLLDWINIQILSNKEYSLGNHHDKAYDLIKMARYELTNTL